MKKLLFAALLVFALAGSCWASDPNVTLFVSEYTDDGSIVENIFAIAPYRQVRFTYAVTSDTDSISYTVSTQSRFRSQQSNGSLVGNPLTILEAITFQPEEECSIEVRVNDGNMASSATTTNAIARAAQPGEEPKPEPDPGPIFDPDPAPQYPVAESRVKFDPAAINLDEVGSWNFLSPVMADGGWVIGFTNFISEGLTYDVTIDDPTIVSIDNEMASMMTVTALKPGTTRITLEVFTQDGTYTGDHAECVVTVTDPSFEQPGGPVDIPSEPETPSGPGGGGGGCNSGLPILALAGMILLRKR